MAVLVVIILDRRRNNSKALPSAAASSYQEPVAAGEEVNPKALTLMEVIGQGPFGELTRALLKTLPIRRWLSRACQSEPRQKASTA